MRIRAIYLFLGAGAISSILLGLAGCRPGAAVANEYLATPFIVPGASAISTTQLNGGDWQIRYRSPPGVPSTWVDDVARRLAARGWKQTQPAAYAALNHTFERQTPFAVGEFREWAFVFIDPFEPQQARIRVRRSLELPWWHRTKRLLSRARRELESRELVLYELDHSRSK